MRRGGVEFGRVMPLIRPPNRPAISWDLAGVCGDDRRGERDDLRLISSSQRGLRHRHSAAAMGDHQPKELAVGVDTANITQAVDLRARRHPRHGVMGHIHAQNGRAAAGKRKPQASSHPCI